jgi:hypothetical protein
MATIDIGRVGQRGGVGEASPAEPEPRADAGFERQLVTARATAPSRAAHADAGKTRTIAAQATRLSGSEAAASLAVAYETVFHQPPTPATLRVLVAQWSHETGGGRAMMNFNFGGIKGSSPSGLSAAYLTTEGEATAQVKLVDRFRAYGSAIEGATDYVNFLAKRFSGAMSEAQKGDAEGFVRALKRGGYFTGSEEEYVRSVTRLTEQAKVGGFDAVGRGAAAAEQVARIPVHPSVIRAGNGLGAPARSVVTDETSNDPAAQLRAYYAADALAMADELCRAAMRIAATDDDRRKG